MVVAESFFGASTLLRLIWLLIATTMHPLCTSGDLRDVAVLQELLRGMLREV